MLKFEKLTNTNRALVGQNELYLVVGDIADLKNSVRLKKSLGALRAKEIVGLCESQGKFKAGQTIFVPPSSKTTSPLLIVAWPEKLTALTGIEKLRDALKVGIQDVTKSICAHFLVGKTGDSAQLAQWFGTALAARTLSLPKYGEKAKEQAKQSLKNIFCDLDPGELRKGFIFGESTHRVRELGLTPANKLNPEIYGRTIRELCKTHKIKVKFHSNKILKKMGAGAFTAVDQADPDSAGGIWELEYNPARRKNKKAIALVGKGLCYDTGGYDIKTGGHMATMKGDMQGSAVALATLIASSQLKWPLHLKAWLAVTENHISPKGFKADDVVIALNGKSIEVIDTDAEGRMVLADTLTLATREKPEICIDFATLTGAAVRAIGKRYGVAFTNKDTWHKQIVEGGLASGERVWPFPIIEDYNKDLESLVADTAQCGKGPGPDHILAALFLEKFVEKDVPWIHVDLAASECEGGLGPTDTLFTGFGARWALTFIESNFL